MGRESTQTSSTGLDTQTGEDGKATARHSDMGCTLPVFPGDVRDSMYSPPGGSEFPIHRYNLTLPHISKHDEYVGASTAA
jgi:hypothetical protein